MADVARTPPVPACVRPPSSWRTRLIAALTIVSIGGPLAAQPTTWTGAASGSWTDPANWSAGVPGAATMTTVPAGTPNQPVLAGAGNVCGALTVAAGAAVSLPAGATLAAGGSVTVQGAITGNGLLRLVGSGTTTSQNAPLPNVEVQSASTVTLAAGGTIAGTLAVLSGSLAVAGPGTTTVQGAATFSGGSLVNSGGTLEIFGATTFAGTTATSPPALLLHGSWTADAAWNPTSNTVTFAGPAPQAMAGSPLRFRNLTIAAGAAASTAGDLTTNGTFAVAGTLAVGGVLDANGAVTVSAGGSLGLGSGVHQLAGSLTATAGAFAAGGVVRFDGAGTVNTGAANILPSVEIQATSTVTLAGGAAIGGDLTLTGGSLAVAGPGAVTVQGAAVLTGGTLLDSSGVLDVLGAVAVIGTAASSPPAMIVRGDWSSGASWNPSSGTVTFAGATPQAMTGAPLRFRNLTIATGAVANAPGDVQVNGTLVVDGSLAVLGAADVNGSATVAAGGSLALGAGPHAFASSLTANAGTLTAGGLVRFDGSGTMNLGGGNPLAAVEVDATSTVTITGGTVVGGPLTHLGGNLGIASPGTVTVQGGAAFAGGTLLNAGGTLEISGATAFTGTVAMSPPVLVVHGDWSSDAAWNPGSNGVTFAGPAPQTMTGAPLVFRNLTIAAGAQADAPGAVAVNGALQVAGTLTAAALDAAGAVTVPAGGSLGLGAGPHAVGGSLTANAGTLTVAGLIRFDGGGAVNPGPTNPLAAVEVDATSSVTLTGGTVVAGDLTLLAGNLSMGSPGTVNVQGDALLLGGALLNAGGQLDVDGDLRFLGAAFTSTFAITCGGDFEADAAFAPAGSQTVTLDGPGTHAIGAAASGQTVAFRNLVLSQGAREAALDFTLQALSIVIQPGAELAAGARDVTIPASPVAVNGTLAAGAGGSLALGAATSVTVAAGGTLRVVGTPTAPAVVTGAGGGGYALAVSGTLEALHFRFEQMGPAGVVVAAAATIAPPPLDLRRGVFSMPAAPGAALLDVQRPSPQDFRYLAFENPAAVAGAFNVRCTAGAAISLTNWSGGFAGPAFEDDPGARVAWNGPALTTLAVPFSAEPGPALATLSWTTQAEEDVAAFVVERAPSPSGPFTVAGSVAPQGGGMAYAFVDQPLAADVEVFYRLREMLIDGVFRLLGTASATPWSASLPPNVLTVGAGGFATIQEAIDVAVLPRSVIRVLPGSYAAFTVGATAPPGLWIMAEGGGPVVIDTTAGPVTIGNRPASSSTSLAGLTIGTGTGGAGLLVQGCSGPVVLDQLAVTGGPGAPGIFVVASIQVAVQRSALSGTPGLCLDSGSNVVAVGGPATTLAVQGGSILETCDLPGPVTVQPGSTHVARPGAVPDLALPRFPPLGAPFDLVFTAAPGLSYVIGFNLDFTWFQFPEPDVELALLIDPFASAFFDLAVMDATGTATMSLTLPPSSLMLGEPLVFQGASLDLIVMMLRFSTASTLMGVP